MITLLEKIKQHRFPFEIDSRLPQYHLTYVDFSKILITEKQLKRFDPSHVMDIYNNFHPALLRPSSIVDINGQLFCWDGLHSAVVALLKGFDECPSVVFQTDSWDFLKIPTEEKFDEDQLISLYASLPDEFKTKLG